MPDTVWHPMTDDSRQPLMISPTLITNIRMFRGLTLKPPQSIVISPGAGSVTVPLIGKKVLELP